MLQAGVATEVELIVTACELVSSDQLFLLQKLIKPTAKRASDSLHEDTQFDSRNLAVVKFAKWMVIKSARERTTNHLLPRPVPQIMLLIPSFRDLGVVGATSLTDSPFVSIRTTVHDHRKRQTKSGNGTCSELQTYPDNPWYFAGRRSPKPPSATCKLANEEVTSAE